MNKNDIKKIIEDLYRLDPRFREKPEFPRIVEEILSAQPGAELDEHFITRLRAQLMIEAKKNMDRRPISSPFARWLRLGVPVAAIIAVIVYAGTSGVFTRNSRSNELTFSAHYIDREAQAFGSFTGSSVAPLTNDSVAFGKGGDSVDSTSGTAIHSEPSNAGSESDRMAMSITYPYPFTQYEYVYAGEPNPLMADSGNVLKRAIGVAVMGNLVSAISRAKFGGLDLSTFRDLEVQNLQVAENREGGYLINIDFIGGYIYIGKNWKFGSPYPDQPETQAQLMSDEQAILIANAFLKAHKMSTTAFGAPTVEPLPEIMPLMEEAISARPIEAASSDAKMMAYIPEIVTVVYPLTIDGVTVHEEGGILYGMRVGVNVRTGEVDSVSEFGTQTYERSSYPLVTETPRLIDYLNKRSIFPTEPGMEIKKVTVTLGTPTVVYMRHWKSDESGSQSNEYLIPAAAFPIIAGGESHYTKTVVVPLVDDFLSAQPIDGPVYRIMEEDTLQ